jgi:hypothetical protein
VPLSLGELNLSAFRSRRHLQIALLRLHLILYDKPSFAFNYGIDTDIHPLSDRALRIVCDEQRPGKWAETVAYFGKFVASRVGNNLTRTSILRWRFYGKENLPGLGLLIALLIRLI